MKFTPDDINWEELDKLARQFFGMPLQDLIEKFQKDFGNIFNQGGVEFTPQMMKDMMDMINKMGIQGSGLDAKSFGFIFKNGAPSFIPGFANQTVTPTPQDKLNPDGTIEPYTELSVVDNKTIIIAEIPGVEKSGLQIKLKNDGLHIVARASEQDVVYSKLVTFNHVKAIDKKRIAAKLNNGILEVTLFHLPNTNVEEDFIIDVED